MGFLIYCDNKGCGEHMEPLLDVNSNKAYCSECGEEVKSITHFAKVQMKSMGQTMKKQSTQRAFAVQCQYCGNSDTPKIGENNNLQCRKCSRDLDNISPAYAHVIRQNVKSIENGN